MMQMKLFRAWGDKEIDALEMKINDWLSANMSREVRKIATALGTIDGQQQLVVTIWHEPPSARD